MGIGRFFLFRRLLKQNSKRHADEVSRHDFYDPEEMLDLGLIDRKKKKVKIDRKEKYALVVEDDENIAKLVKSWLEIKGFVVHTASDGAKAMDLLDKYRFCIMTTDIVMPGFDGIQLINYVKSSPTLYDMPVIVLSILDKSDLGNFFADAYIKKPFDGFDFLKTVDELTTK